MDLANLPLFSAITRKMSWLTERQRVLAQNVANIDTPGYRSSDLRPLDFSRELAQAAGTGSAPKLAPVATDPHHLAGTEAAGGAWATNKRKVTDGQINGNAVSIEDELMKVSDTAADYQLMTDLYKKQVNLLNTALDRSGG